MREPWRSSQPSPLRTSDSCGNASGGGAENRGVQSAVTYETRRRRYSTVVNVALFAGGSMRRSNGPEPRAPAGISAANMEQGAGTTGLRSTASCSLNHRFSPCQNIWNECGSAMGAVSSSMRIYTASGGGGGILYIAPDTHHGSTSVTSNA